MQRFAAIDLGASSGRVMVGRVGPEELELTEAARFPNRPVMVNDGLHWSVLTLFSEALEAIAAASHEAEISGIAVDSWAVDYGLLRQGSLLSVPYSYRDSRTERGLELVDAVISQPELYARCGLQRMPFTTINQLSVDRERGMLELADTMLMLPDLFNYWMTGRQAIERTNATTTGMMRLDGSWDLELLEMLGIEPSLLPPLIDSGTVVGPLLPGVREHFGVHGDPQVYAVGSHDTASAVVAAPLASGAAFISSGTWSLVGVETAHPITCADAERANFTNEGGVDGRNRFMKNVMGMWLLSESKRAWEAEGEGIELTELLRAAAEHDAEVPVFDATDEIFYAPADMPAAIRGWFAARGIRPPEGKAAITRCILESLADAYARAIADIERISGQRITQVNVVGGGSRNSLLCRLTARRTGVPVYAGPVEASAIGNLLVQARAAGVLSGSLADLRDLVSRVYKPQRYDP
ncbi:rhamnulokinase family protein [Leucobacter ruminantium]